jgi:hypothetical protein
MSRPTASRLVEVKAECQRCNWTADKPNAQALAAQHFDKKGHQVRVTTKNEIIYGRHSGTTRTSASKQGTFL